MRTYRRLIFLATVTAGLVSSVFVACSDDENAGGSRSTPDGGGGGTDSAKPPTDTGGGTDTGPTTIRARVTIAPTSDAGTDGGPVTGTGEFVELDNTVTLTLTLSGASPGLHGLHIHQGNNCNTTIADAAADSDSGPIITPGGGAGAHWNVDDAGHGYPDAAAHHIGDIGNLTVDSTGKATLTFKSTQWRVATGTVSVIGHAIIFHAAPDDGITQPTGDSGARQGCGVIREVP